jgi:hypothetical protein
MATLASGATLGNHDPVRGRDPRYEALGDSSYRQHGDVYILRLKEVVPNGSSPPGTPR